MNELFSLILRSGTKEALFVALWLELGAEPGRFERLDLGRVVAIAARRGLALSEAQARGRLNALEKIGVVERVERRERGVFDLFVYRPAPNETSATEPETVERVEDRPLFAASPGALDFDAPHRSQSQTRFENEIEIGIETRAESDRFHEAAKTLQAPTVASVAPESEPRETPNRLAIERAQESINININQERNQGKKRPEEFLETMKGAASAANVRDYVDFDAPETVALRAEVAKIVWERGVRPDVVDRLTAAIRLRLPGLTRLDDVRAIDREARDAVALYERSKGYAGRCKRWQTTNLTLRAIYEAAGYEYPATTRGYEPSPFNGSSASTRRPKRDAEAADARTVDELLSVAAGFEPSELDASFDDFSRLVARRRGIADAFEARGVALTIRSALRELAKRELATA